MSAVVHIITRGACAALMAVFLLAGQVCAEDRFEMTFAPAFHPSSTIRIIRVDDKTTLNFLYSDLKTQEQRTEEFLLDGKVADRFFARMDELAGKWFWTLNIIACLRITFYDGISLGPAIYSMYDGFSVEGSYITGSSPPFRFKSQSPSKKVPHEPRDYDITLAVFKVLDSLDGLNPPRSLTEYIEQISIYNNERPFPARIFGGNPFRVRFYGMLSSGDDKDLKKLIDGLPTDKPLVIDMSNFQGMGTILYPRFLELIRRNPDITWISSREAKRQLLEIGVPEEKIEDVPAQPVVR